jgi:hypothetical protein
LADTIAFSAKPPKGIKPTIASPTLKCFTFSPTFSMIPATSLPGEKGNSGLN